MKLKRVKSFFKFLGTANWYQGIDKPNFLQWLYQWRLGFKTSWKIAKLIWE